ncbi:MAG: hypothetical protein PHD48_06370 [Alphaproteobacteria bacterium]|nr:hypothetical protein [Alphaproteobacteria bacterium]
MQIQKTLKLGLMFFVLVAIGIGFVKKETLWPTGELAAAQKSINLQIETTYRTGQRGTISFKPTSESFLLISPPYADLTQLAGQPLSPALEKEIKTEIEWTETGHLFLIKKGQIIDHRLLSNLAEPILGSAEGPAFLFSISREETSGRPVKIELVK